MTQWSSPRPPVSIAAAPAAYLVVGVPGSGKSTVSRALAQRYRLGAHIEVDRLQEMVVSGGRWPRFRWDPEADRQTYVRAKNAAALAQNFYQAGIVPVIDDVVVWRNHLDYYLAKLAGLPLRFIVLAPSPHIAAHRNATRRKVLTTDWNFLDRTMHEQLHGVGAWIDSSGMDVATTVNTALSVQQNVLLQPPSNPAAPPPAAQPWPNPGYQGQGQPQQPQTWAG
jgi:predicted kinase